MSGTPSTPSTPSTPASRREALRQKAAAKKLGVPDARWGERPLPVVVLKADAGAVSAEDIIAYLRTQAESGRISRFAVPEQIRFVDSIDKTSVGKINKRQMRERYAGG